MGGHDRRDAIGAVLHQRGLGTTQPTRRLDDHGLEDPLRLRAGGGKLRHPPQRGLLFGEVAHARSRLGRRDRRSREAREVGQVLLDARWQRADAGRHEDAPHPISAEDRRRCTGREAAARRNLRPSAPGLGKTIDARGAAGPPHPLGRAVALAGRAHPDRHAFGGIVESHHLGGAVGLEAQQRREPDAHDPGRLGDHGVEDVRRRGVARRDLGDPPQRRLVGGVLLQFQPILGDGERDRGKIRERRHPGLGRVRERVGPAPGRNRRAPDRAGDRDRDDDGRPQAVATLRPQPARSVRVAHGVKHVVQGPSLRGASRREQRDTVVALEAKQHGDVGFDHVRDRLVDRVEEQRLGGALGDDRRQRQQARLLVEQARRLAADRPPQRGGAVRGVRVVEADDLRDVPVQHLDDLVRRSLEVPRRISVLRPC